MCKKAVESALKILRDADAPYWDKAEAESYLHGEMIRPSLWIARKAISWTVWFVDGFTMTNDPERVFAEWLHNAIAEA